MHPDSLYPMSFSISIGTLVSRLFIYFWFFSLILIDSFLPLLSKYVFGLGTKGVIKWPLSHYNSIINSANVWSMQLYSNYGSLEALWISCGCPIRYKWFQKSVPTLMTKHALKGVYCVMEGTLTFRLFVVTRLILKSKWNSYPLCLQSPTQRIQPFEYVIWS